MGAPLRRASTDRRGSFEVGMSRGGGLRDSYDIYSNFGGSAATWGLLTSAMFTKMTRDAQLFDKRLTTRSLDLIFTKSAERGQKRITWEQFLHALELVADGKVESSLDEVHSAVAKLATSAPSLNNASKAESVRFHDDQSTYTGVHKAGGPTTIDNKLSLSSLADRSSADVRGVRKTETSAGQAPSGGGSPSAPSRRGLNRPSSRSLVMMNRPAATSSSSTRRMSFGTTKGNNANDVFASLATKTRRSSSSSSSRALIADRPGSSSSLSSSRGLAPPSHSGGSGRLQEEVNASVSRMSPYYDPLSRYLRVHAPSRAADVPALLVKYLGREDELLAKLETKYGEAVKLSAAAHRALPGGGDKAASFRASSQRSIVDKLTDHTAYTGTHKLRFDSKTGAGRGMAGRDSTPKGIGKAPSMGRFSGNTNEGTDITFKDSSQFLMR